MYDEDLMGSSIALNLLFVQVCDPICVNLFNFMAIIFLSGCLKFSADACYKFDCYRIMIYTNRDWIAICCNLEWTQL